MDRRLCPRQTRPSSVAHRPSASGPRCATRSRIRSISARSTHDAETAPTIPHITRLRRISGPRASGARAPRSSSPVLPSRCLSQPDPFPSLHESPAMPGISLGLLRGVGRGSYSPEVVNRRGLPSRKATGEPPWLRGSAAYDGSVAASETRTLAPGVPSDYYDRIAEVERDHWWYRGTREIAGALLGRRLVSGGRLLDAGCGTGGFLRWALDEGSFSQ